MKKSVVTVSLAFWLLTLIFSSNSQALEPPPLRRSPAKIRAWLLDQTPLGSRRSEARALLKREGWHNNQDEHGSWIGAEIARSRNFFSPTFVYASWEFDRSGRLKTVEVRRFQESI